MPSIKRAIKYLIHNRAQFIDSCVKNVSFLFPDKIYLKLRFRCNLGYWPNFKNPKTFNEKLNWLKLYNRKPVYSKMVDKYEVKGIVSEMIGAEYIIPTLGVWSSAESIDWDSLPKQFVLKTTHGGGSLGVVICQDKNNFDKEAAIHLLNCNLRSDIFNELREWPYKNANKRIIAEKYLDTKGKELNDYKFFCFNGKVRCFKVDFGRFVEHHANYYTPSGSLLSLGEKVCTPQPEFKITFPENLSRMIEIAEQISAGHPFMRVDLYNVDGKIYFGEITFYPAGGIGKFIDSSWDERLGNWIEI